MRPQPHSRTVALITAPILAICLTACGYFPKTSAEAAPPASPSPSASPTPNPEALKVKDTWTDAELPTQPDLADQSLQGGANAAAYFSRLFWHALHTKDYEVIEKYIIPGSKAEQLTKKLVHEFIDGKQTFEGDEIINVPNIWLQKAGPEDYIYAVKLELNPAKIAADNFTTLGIFERREDVYVITMKYVDDQWLLDAVHYGVKK